MTFHRKPSNLPVEFYGPLVPLCKAALIEIIYDLLTVSPYFSEASLLDSPKAGARKVFQLHAIVAPDGAALNIPKGLRDVRCPDEVGGLEADAL